MNLFCDRRGILKYTKDDLLTSITGFLMALADSVPGVSGGSIAYIMGKYEDFVHSIASLSSKDNKLEKKNAISFLIKLMIGWAIGIVLALLVVSVQVVQRPYQLASLFLGFVVISIPFIVKSEHIQKHLNISGVISSLIGILIVVFLTRTTNSLVSLNADRSIFTYLYILFGGMIAICAMVLPGISGSTFLLIFGLYVPVINSVRAMLHFDFTHLDIVVLFGIGVLIGIVSFSKIVKYLLERHRSQTVFFVIGLMIGSLYAIVNGPKSLTDKITGENLGLSALSIDSFHPIWFLVGVLIIIGLEQMKRRMKDN
jgi:putative membrane protein